GISGKSRRRSQRVDVLDSLRERKTCLLDALRKGGQISVCPVGASVHDVLKLAPAKKAIGHNAGTCCLRQIHCHLEIRRQLHHADLSAFCAISQKRMENSEGVTLLDLLNSSQGLVKVCFPRVGATFYA